MKRIGLIDYGMGNLHSVQRAFERLQATVIPVHDAAAMEPCEALVLPGVGAFDPAMARLESSGLADATRSWCDAGRPLLGICLGLQLLFEASDEGVARGLGLLAGRVRALPRTPGHPIPHMGWEPLLPATPSPLLPAGSPEAWVYFVHSYAADPTDPACTTARVDFAGQAITAAVWQGEIGACQFHPEKSGAAGQALLQRWLHWLDQRQEPGA
ncbi:MULTISPECIES: imidazole glycerol phosphate synthase subunit HisH [Aphanothece]|uniref:imidazole glycerol phosphate synthase subunit HisH n=1 Tax=Aphanothece TaxID=1121 RepID=UPI0039854DB3